MSKVNAQVSYQNESGIVKNAMIPCDMEIVTGITKKGRETSVRVGAFGNGVSIKDIINAFVTTAKDIFEETANEKSDLIKMYISLSSKILAENDIMLSGISEQERMEIINKLKPEVDE